MIIEWIKISMLAVGIILSTCYFLRSSYLKRKNAKKLEIIQKKLDEGFLCVGHKIDLLDRQLQDMCMDIKDLNIRTNIVETRLEERNAAFLMSSVPTKSGVTQIPLKRGRPRKVAEN